MAKITVQNTEITVLPHNDKDYIFLTDMANGKQSESRVADIIKNWIRTRYTIEFFGTWEMIHNPNFNVVEFYHFRINADFINDGVPQGERLVKLNQIAIQQMQVLEGNSGRNLLK
jgi:hypothetical protein